MAESQGVAQDDRRLTVNVHPRALLTLTAEVTVKLLLVEQPLQPSVNVMAVDAQHVRLSST